MVETTIRTAKMDEIKLGDYIIRRTEEGKVFISRNGEGMECDEEDLAECIEQFYEENF